MKISPRLVAVLQALLVTLLWSLSWVLIKIGLVDIPPLTFAGLRYVLAFLCLLPIAWRRGEIVNLRRISPAGWGMLVVLGLVYYTATQGGQFFTLVYIPAANFSMLLNFTVVIVAVLGIFFLGERVTGGQWAGLAVFLGGVLLFFYQQILPAGQRDELVVGYVAAGVTVIANALAALLGRAANRGRTLSPLAVTTVSMGVGSIVLLLIGLLVEPFPHLTINNWLLILWLAVVHTAFTFTLWNVTLRTLSASESAIINNTMLIQIALLAWIFLGESLSWQQVIGMLLAALGIFAFQWWSGQQRLSQ
jgi:drug/metabolite transporter (DMT)-like permease